MEKPPTNESATTATQKDALSSTAAAPAGRPQQNPAPKKRSLPSPHEVIEEHAASMESSKRERQQQQHQHQQNASHKKTSSSHTSGSPTAKRSKGEESRSSSAIIQQQHNQKGHDQSAMAGGETPPTTEKDRLLNRKMPPKTGGLPPHSTAKTPVPHVHRSQSSGSVSSDLSSSSASTQQMRHEALSPIPPTFVSEVPPAPPSTPASTASHTILNSNVWDFGPNMPGLMTPLPVQPPVLNAQQLEEQQWLAEGAVTPAPNRDTDDYYDGGPPTAAAPAPHTMLSDDFSDWAVGDRYKMVRVLGRGSYGEVAQALDLRAGRSDAFVAIKRIQSPFDQEVDAIRLYREIHILRQMRGHECIIQLVDVVQPPTDDLDDFHDLYLVFECKWLLLKMMLSAWPLFALDKHQL